MFHNISNPEAPDHITALPGFLIPGISFTSATEADGIRLFLFWTGQYSAE